MATRNIVPRATGEGSIGTAAKHWGAGHFDTLPNWQEYLAESTGYGIVSGCTPTISGLTVSVASGVVHLANGTRKEISASTVTLDAADSTNPRIDLVYIDSTGTVAKITGTAAASPSAPAVPTGGISVVQVSVAAGATTGTITDSREFALSTNKNIMTVKEGHFDKLVADDVIVDTITADDVIAKGPVVDVRAFGAKGDGVTDDTAAIKKALDSAKTIIFPTGTYITSEPLIVNGNTIIGCGSTIIKVGNATLSGYPSPSVPGNPSFDVNTLDAVIIIMANKNNTILPTTGDANCRIEELTVTIQSDSETTYGYYFTQGNSSLFIKTNAVGCTYGYRFFSVWVITLLGCHATENTYGFWFGQETDSIRGTSIMLNNCYANHNSIYGFKMSYMTYSAFNTCACDGGREGYVLDNCYSTSINSSGAEMVDGAKWHITNSKAITVLGNEAYIGAEMTDSSGDYSYHIIVKNSSSVVFRENNFFVKYGLLPPQRALFDGDISFEHNSFGEIITDNVNNSVVKKRRQEISDTHTNAESFTRTFTAYLVRDCSYLVFLRVKLYKAGVSQCIYSVMAVVNNIYGLMDWLKVAEQNDDVTGMLSNRTLQMQVNFGSDNTLNITTSGTITIDGVSEYQVIDIIKM